LLLLRDRRRPLLDLRLPLLRLLELRRLLDFRELDLRELDLRVWPDSRRCLLTVRAAISSARSLLMPRFFPDCLMCLYCRLRLLLFTPRGGMAHPPHA
jgi:hypothetical protein